MQSQRAIRQRNCPTAYFAPIISPIYSRLFVLVNKSIDPRQAAEGTGLAFIVFTQAIVELPGAPFWSCIFFLMLLALGLGSQIGILEGMLCVIFDIDLFKRIKKQYMTGTIIVAYFFSVDSFLVEGF